ncbi:MAG: DUF58 domain-containing protein, partial [Anaerolineae bacterium]|nr:DUF58 domain-containing protein [Anaerolineae bacterium]
MTSPDPTAEARRRTIHTAPAPYEFALIEETNSAKPWAVAALFLAFLGLLLQSRALLAAASMLGTSLLTAWIWAKLSFHGLQYERDFCDADGQRGYGTEIRAFLGETVTLTLRVRNRKLLPLSWLRSIDIFPADLPVEGANVIFNRGTHQGELSAFWRPGAYETLERDFTIHCTERGYASFGPVTLSTGDGFGWFERRARLRGEHRLIIYPRLYTPEALGLPAKNPFGDRVSEQRLFEDPLRTAGVRDWHPGDRLSRVHWRASAKQQHLLSRVYEPSEDPQIQIVLNVATLERHWEGVFTEKHEQAISVAATLAYLANGMRMPVGLLANCYLPGSDQVIRLLPGRSQAQLMNILEALAAATPYASQPLEDFVMRWAPGLPWGATIALVTVVTYPGLWEALRELALAGR